MRVLFALAFTLSACFVACSVGPSQQNGLLEGDGSVDAKARDGAVDARRDADKLVEAGPHECEPVEESCNSLDDDCDRRIDEDLGMQSCGVGACAVEVDACRGGAPAKCIPGEPVEESCNGLDDDCDGTADNGNLDPGTACTTERPGICAAGTERCVDGSIKCMSNVGADNEVCNGLDDDCDGTVDNGSLDPGTACETGKLGICAVGTKRCVNGTIACVDDVAAVNEMCNGLDDDCDGSKDEGNPGGNAGCDTGKKGICAAGKTVCESGGIQCEQTQPAASDEVCNNSLDDDCNGMIDDGCCELGTQDCNSAGGCECIGTACCGTGCQSAHQNGLGNYFFDCEPLGTRTLTQAVAACRAFTGDSSLCYDLGAACDSGSTSAVCSTAASQCACWTYAGTNTGRVFLNEGSTTCLCPLSTDPMWN